ncbi:uncharacterized protein BDW47DRAFT_114780 [Aspergillus candidus]|uniref:Myb-like domain-containing protein n=1 Tax=Aspergillus candidus TaxID=41067 RepID=A0A2I2FPZ7_ASPCN|nr:hypothetical protein BDW47DRAFT_114780 [Aspergillus candidus]PLB42689.1 hypothetical protein BDW47DRAFT_114780 [Aspergillus candidus]
MSSSSSYEPDDNDASDSDIETRAHVPPSSPPARNRLVSPSHEPNGPSSARINLRAKRGTRDQVLNDLYTSLGQESVDAYHSLLEDAIGDSVPSRNPVDENYNATQNGIVIWTPQEKQVFYNWLHRKGRNGVAEIASAIGSKSELEVQEFLRLLHRGLERQHLRDRHTRTIILGDVPAAADVGRKCCSALDQYAELLALEEQQTEDDVGRARNHDLWIIDRDNAQEVDDEVQDAEKADTQLDSDSSVYHTAGLFNLSTWIRLSERFFMNPGGARMDDNWVNVGFAGESPSMTADSLADFYTLAVSVTRRLVHSTLFFAMSRLRNMRETGNAKAKVVRSRDVHTALDVLGMKRDRVDHWVGLARRCNLTVEDVRNRRGWKPVLMVLDDVEDILSGRAPYDTESRERSISNRRPGAKDEPEDEDDDDSEDESSHPSRESSILSSPAESLPDNEDQTPVDPEDDHAEQLDQEASRLEESHLWEILGHPQPQPSLKSDNHPTTTRAKKRPVGERKTQDDLANWRDRTLYRSDWEEHGHDTVGIYEEISENRRKRRRLPANSAISHSENAADEDDNQTHTHMEVDNDTNNNKSPPPTPTPTLKQDSSQSQPITSEKAQRSPFPEPKNEHTSSSEDDDLPSARERSSLGDIDDEEDEKVDKALFSRPMSPLGWEDD